MSEAFKNSHITEAHYAALGRVVHSFSRIEALIEEAITGILKLEQWQAAFAFAQSGYEQKNKLLLTLISESKATAAEQKECTDLLDKIKKKATLRNNAAHCLCKKGRKKDSIKPMILKVTGVLLLRGMEHNEKEWTAEELNDEALEILKLGAALGKPFDLNFSDYL